MTQDLLENKMVAKIPILTQNGIKPVINRTQNSEIGPYNVQRHMFLHLQSKISICLSLKPKEFKMDATIAKYK